MYTHSIHQRLNQLLQKSELDLSVTDNAFYVRALANIHSLHQLFFEVYPVNEITNNTFDQLVLKVIEGYKERSATLRERDKVKEARGKWFLDNKLAGMSLYVDRFCGNLTTLNDKLSYFKELGANLLHLMPLFESPEGESDGGYAVSNFRKVDSRFGSLEDLTTLQQKMGQEGMYLMLDIVLNHTSHKHEWANKAKAGEKKYQDYFYTYPDRTVPDQFEQAMPEIFPESSPGNFTFNKEMNRWVMTVFHNYQWDLNYANPVVLNEMLSTILFFANLGVDVLRIDAPAFIWKQVGTSCQNLPQAHALLRLIKCCVEIAAPGMAILGEAIVAPKEIMKYFGTGNYTARECDFAYNATHMALQWDMLATTDTRVMLAAQPDILQKPFGTTWITYTRCHDDIGLGYEDSMIQQAGYDPYLHRKFMKDYYSGQYAGSPSKGALFSFNPKTGDARISGSLASLCGLEKAFDERNEAAIETSIHKILLMQAHCFLLGGLPMIFYGDEVGYTNDYGYLNDPGKSYDNRWMHRPIIDWEKMEKRKKIGTLENRIFTATKKLLEIRSSLPCMADHKNIAWLNTRNIHVAGYLRTSKEQNTFCLFNFNNTTELVALQLFVETTVSYKSLFDHWTGSQLMFNNNGAMKLKPYEFMILEAIK
jgi:amylosucrase